MSNPGPASATTAHYLIGGDSTDGTAIAINGGPVGFFGHAPVSQQTASASVTTVAAGSVTAAYVNTSFDGGVGSTGYTVGDVVKALKNLGLIAQ